MKAMPSDDGGSVKKEAPLRIPEGLSDILGKIGA